MALAPPTKKVEYHPFVEGLYQGLTERFVHANKSKWSSVINFECGSSYIPWSSFHPLIRELEAGYGATLLFVDDHVLVFRVGCKVIVFNLHNGYVQWRNKDVESSPKFVLVGAQQKEEDSGSEGSSTVGIEEEQYEKEEVNVSGCSNESSFEDHGDIGLTQEAMGIEQLKKMFANMSP
jgi:hypothetical protein